MDLHYIKMARDLADNSNCLRRRYGAVIVKNNIIVSKGFNSAPEGRKSCEEKGFCQRNKLGIPSRERYELCASVHAEQNAMIKASYREMIDSTIYIGGIDYKLGEITDCTPCVICRRMIINAGIKRIVVQTNDGYEELDINKLDIMSNIV